MLGHREDPGPASPGLETVSGKEAAETLASFLSLAPTLRRCLYQIRRAFCRLGALGTRKEGIRLAHYDFFSQVLLSTNPYSRRDLF